LEKSRLEKKFCFVRAQTGFVAGVRKLTANLKPSAGRRLSRANLSLVASMMSLKSL
jgi:hypothetical protein